MNYTEFNWESSGREIIWAENIGRLIVNDVLVFPQERELETLFIIDEQLNFFDISAKKSETRVDLNWDLYNFIAYKHVLIHNHPTGGVWPSDADWNFDLDLTKINRLCAFNMVWSPYLKRVSMFRQTSNERFFKQFCI